MFAHIYNSSWLYEYLGDKAARAKIEECQARLDSIARRHGGAIVKTIGEKIMCNFPASANAIEAAIAMQQEMASLAARDPDALHIKIGLHFGEVTQDGGEILGDTVNVAARMAGLAAVDQIVTTQQTADSLPPALRPSIRFLGQTTVKDNCEDKHIFEVIWEIEEAVTRMPTPQSRSGGTSTLGLKYADQQLTLSLQSPSTMVGRDKSCGIVVDDPLASRNHARIELRNGKFVMVDQSTNGTYLNQGDKVIFLRGEEVLLSGNGFFALGHEVASNSPDAVHYSCKY